MPMSYLLNLVYLLVLSRLLALALLHMGLTTGKYRRGFWTKLTGRVVAPTKARRETYRMVSRRQRWRDSSAAAGDRRLPLAHPEHMLRRLDHHDTGHEEACKAFPDLQVIFWPFDFTWSIKTALRRIRPTWWFLPREKSGQISYAWPNKKVFGSRSSMAESVPVVPGVTQIAWGRTRHLCAAGRVRSPNRGIRRRLSMVGARNVLVTGNVKYDGACADRSNPGDHASARPSGHPAWSKWSGWPAARRTGKRNHPGHLSPRFAQTSQTTPDSRAAPERTVRAGRSIYCRVWAALLAAQPTGASLRPIDTATRR